MAGPGTATLSGSNSYEGGTAVTGGTLIVTASGALPDGTSLTVGADAASIFGDLAVVRTPSASSSSSAVAAAVVAPLQAPAPVTAPGAAAAAPSALPADSPWKAASDSLWKSYAPTAGPAAVQSSRIAGYLAWLNSSVQSSSAEDSATETDRRIAALDAVLAQYGSP